jgi:hypothetical protein
LQLFGEFLHTYEDTFAHRDRTSNPINVNGGLGHGGYGENPDKTYNHSSLIGGWWGNNEQRTYQMEVDTFAQLVAFAPSNPLQVVGGRLYIALDSGSKILYSDIFGDGYWGSGNWLGHWNERTSSANQISAIEAKLRELGLGDLPRYDVTAACNARRRNTAGLVQADYPGTILTTGGC